MKIVGFFGLKESLPLKADCLNRKYKVKIGDFEGVLLTPSLPNDFYKNSDSYRDELIQPKCEINFNDNLKWGEPFSWPDGDSYISNLKLEISIDETAFNDKTRELLFNETESWIERFRHNFFAFGFLLGEKRIKILSSSWLGFKYYIKNQKNITEELKANRENSIEINAKIETVDYKTFKKIINSANNKKELSLEYQLLKSSRIALDNNDFRKSIFESAAALELCFTNILIQKLKVNNEKLKNDIFISNNSIDRKLKLLKLIEFSLPDHEYHKEVSVIRNRAIHAGTKVTEFQAKRAYNVVENTLNTIVKNRLVSII